MEFQNVVKNIYWAIIHFLSVQGYGCKNPGGNLLQEVSFYKIQFQGIYESNGHSFQGILIF